MPKVISKDGTEIIYEKRGKGPNLILVDGAFCFRDSGTTPMMMPLLLQHFTVYSYDRRGRGESGNTQPYLVEKEIEDLQAVVKAIAEPTYMVGFSSGAALALQAVAKGVKVKKLALFEPPYVGTKPPANLIQQLNQMIVDNKRSDAVTYFLTKIMGMPAFFTYIMRLIPGVWAKNMSVAHTLPYDIAIMGDNSVPKAAASITVPTIVITGVKSAESLRKAVAAVTKIIPNAKQVDIEGMSHMIKPNLLLPVLLEFFQE